MKFLTLEEQKKCRYYVIGKSRTMPDQSLSVKDILNNFASGGYMAYLKDGQFDDNANFDSVVLSDFKDIAEIETACCNSRPVLEAYNKALERKNESPKQDIIDENKEAIKA